MLNKIINLLNDFDYLSYLLNKGKSGNAEELAEKTKMSRSTLFENLKDLREHDIPIEYDKTAGCFKTNGKLKFSFIVMIEDEKIIEIKGGKNKNNDFFWKSEFFGLLPSTFAVSLASKRTVWAEFREKVRITPNPAAILWENIGHTEKIRGKWKF